MATVAGVLYEIHGYPVLVPKSCPGCRVIGDLYALPETEASEILRRLDAYEACDDDPPGYRRVILPVTDAQGRVYRAWVYIWTGSLKHARRVPDGDYLRHLRRDDSTLDREKGVPKSRPETGDRG